MIYGKDFDFEGSMSDAVEGGAGLAWRLLATLEGGSLILAASALLAYTARNKIFKRRRSPRAIHNVLVTNTTNLLGRELKQGLERRGCDVRTVTSGTTSGANGREYFDALVVVGAQRKTAGLDGMADFVSEDVYGNLKLLELLSPLIKSGGCIAWVCTGGDTLNGSFSGASAAFDTVIHSSLQHIANMHHCEPVWIGRRNGTEPTADEVVDGLLNSTNPNTAARFFIRNAVHNAGEYVCRWLKIVT